MAEKIKIKSCVLGKTGNSNGKDWTIYNVTTEDGRKFDAFGEFKEGEEVEVDITPHATNPLYNAKIARVKTGFAGKSFAPKDYTSDKRMSALTNAVNSCNKIEGAITTANVIKLADLYFGWLNQK